MIIDRISDSQQLEDLREDWDAIAGEIPFRRWDWNDAWWRHFGSGRELWVLRVRDSSGATIGIAPWFAEPTMSGGRVLRFLGSGQVCSDYLSLLCRPQHQDEVTRGLADWLCGPQARARGEGWLSWDYLLLAGTEADDPAMTLLAERLRSANVSVGLQEHTRCWRIPLPHEWETYLASRPKRYRRKIRRLKEAYYDTGRVTLKLQPSAEPLGESYEQMVSLHRARRRSLHQRGCFDSKPFRGFLRLAAERIQARNQLFLATMQVDEQVAAASLGLVSGDTLYLYQCGMSPQLAHHQPGWLMNMGVIMHGIDSGPTGIDLLCGDEPYKRHLGATPVPLYETCMVSPRAISRLRHSVWSAGLGFKRRIKCWAKSTLKAK